MYKYTIGVVVPDDQSENPMVNVMRSIDAIKDARDTLDREVSSVKYDLDILEAKYKSYVNLLRNAPEGYPELPLDAYTVDTVDGVYDTEIIGKWLAAIFHGLEDTERGECNVAITHQSGTEDYIIRVADEKVYPGQLISIEHLIEGNEFDIDEELVRVGFNADLHSEKVRDSLRYIVSNILTTDYRVREVTAGGIHLWVVSDLLNTFLKMGGVRDSHVVSETTYDNLKPALKILGETGDTNQQIGILESFDDAQDEEDSLE